MLTPDTLSGLSAAEIAALPVQHGNQKAALGDFFRVEGSGAGNGEVHLEGDLTRVKLIGCEMTAGRIVVAGNAGMHVGAAMSGGEIVVEGDAGDWVGAEMIGGRVIVKGNAGHLIGSGYRGSRIGMQGGEIIVHGNVGNEIGGSIRRGLIAVGGNARDFTGSNMHAGTIIVLGTLGMRTGPEMGRGSIVSMHDAALLPTFDYACTYRPTFLRLFLLHLRSLGLPVDDAQINGKYRSWSGDSVHLNRGEILLYAN